VQHSGSTLPSPTRTIEESPKALFQKWSGEMSKAKYQPTAEEKDILDSLLAASERCGLSQGICANSFSYTESGLIIGGFNNDQATELTLRFNNIADIYGSYFTTNRKANPTGEVLGKNYRPPVGYELSRIIMKDRQSKS